MKYITHAHRTVIEKGFTLIETLVAITVLSVALVGPMTIAARGLQSAFFAEQQFVAFYLGQEAMDFIRSVRDYNGLSSQGWLDNIDASCFTATGCDIDVRDGSFRSCATSDACRLRYDSGSLSGNRGFYTYETGNLSPFTRVVRITETVPNQEAEISVSISWQSSVVASKTVNVQSRLFNHYAP